MMKSARFPFLCSLLVVAAVGSVGVASRARAADETPAVAVDPYTAAVQAYVNAASKEISAIRAEVTANEKQGRKERYAPVRNSLQSCEELVTRLKGAGQGQFDLIKAEYERTRSELLQKLNTARQG